MNIKPTAVCLLRDYVPDAESLSLEEFQEKYAPGFLVVHGEVRDESRGPVLVEFRQDATVSEHGEMGPGTLLTSVVHDLSRFRARRTVSLGRGLDVDLFLPDRAVSRLHAVLTWSPSGRVYIQHAGLHSATIVNERPAPTQVGAALEVVSGSLLQLGGMTLTLLSPHDFQRLAWRLSAGVKMTAVT